MAVPKNLVQLAFAGGIDESQEDEVLDPLAAFTRLENGRQERRGGYHKRLGYGGLPLARLDASSRSAGQRIYSHNGILLTSDGTQLDAFDETLAVSAVASRLPEASLTTRTLTTAVTSNAQFYDIVACNGYLATAALQGTSVVVGVETVDGVVVRAPEAVFASSTVATVAQLGFYSTYIILLASDSSTANIAAYYLNTASAATITAGWVSIGNVATDKPTSAVSSFALSAESLTDRVAFAYVNNSGGTSRLTVKTVTIAGVSETATVNTSSVTPTVVCVQGSLADTLWVAWNETTNVKLKGLTGNSLATVLATTATIVTIATAPPALHRIFIVSSATAGAGRIAVNDGDFVNFRARSFITSAGAATTSGSQVGIRGLRMEARPFQYGGRYYSLFRSGDLENGVTVLGDWTDITTTSARYVRPVTVAAPGLTMESTIAHPHYVAISATKIAYATTVERSSIGGSAELLTYDFADPYRGQPALFNGALFFAGGVLSSFDGRRVAEAQFLHAPKTPTATDSGAGTGPTGTFRYVATFEEMNDDGQWCFSGISDPSTITGTITDNTVTVSTDPLTITGRARLDATGTDARMRVSFYRTLTGGAAPYYYVGSVDNVPDVAATYSDSSTDATISSNRLLMGTGALPGTNGSAQDRRSPPFCQDIAAYAGMLVVASGSELWWSGQAVSGEGAWWSPAFVVPVEGPGYVTALEVQDGTLYIWKRDAIYTCAGEAPSDNGASGGLGTPRRLAVDVGCINPRSVVATSLGIFFQSERGIELLTRGGSVKWIGEQIQRTLASHPVVTSAVLDPKAGLVRFSLVESWSGDDASGDGRDAIYDLTLEKWVSVDLKRGSAAAQASQDACIVSYGDVYRYAWIATDGTVYIERLSTDADAHLDGTTWITMAAETSWFKTSGIQGTQQLNSATLLARKVEDVELQMSLSYNYETTFRTARAWTYTEINALLSDGWPVTQLQHLPHDDARCQSVRLRLVDVTPTDDLVEPLYDVANGQGATWIALTLDITPQTGVFGMPDGAI